MEDLEASYNQLISHKTVKDLDNPKALKKIGDLIDVSGDLAKLDGVKLAIELSDELYKRALSVSETATLFYYLANAWTLIRTLSYKDDESALDWKQEEREKEISYLRSALAQDVPEDFPKEIQCRILTNLGNIFSHIGRFSEALEYWDRALQQNPEFAMAIGNRGFCLCHYARILYDQGQSVVCWRYAYNYLRKAVQWKLHPNAAQGFLDCVRWIETHIPQKALDYEEDMHSFSLGDSEAEVEYRKWCLTHRLFLNPLNDLGSYPISARDILTTPDIVVKLNDGPFYHGYFNQMKQEFVSARYLCHEGIVSDKPHFSDKNVLLYNTLDYPSYCLAVEKVKIAFRVAYSLFDKIAYFVNHYLNLGIPEKQVNFRSLWYTDTKKVKGIRADIQQRRNWPLMGLFWLSKDLFEDQPEFRDAIEPDAQRLYEIRNHLEHKYLKLHEGEWSGPCTADEQSARALSDTLATSFYRQEFQEKTFRLLKQVRSALMYLSFAIHVEEGQRAAKRPPNAIVPGIPVDVWEDDWKR